MNRWAKYKFKNGKVAKNRVVIPPMASQTATLDGFATRDTWNHYERLGKSRAGIVFVEYSFIDQSGKGEPNQLGVNLDEQIPGLKKISDTIHKNQALSGLQIVHVGGKTQSELTGRNLIGASSIGVPIKDSQLEVPQAANLDIVEQLVSWYLESTYRAFKAGFDIVELHAAHGYGLNQWLSPITNQRSDDYGLNIVGRSLLLRRIAAEIKAHLPQLLLAVRLPAQDHFPGGLNYQEMIWVSQELENIGVDLIDVSSGIGGWRRPRGIEGEGYLIDDASTLKSELTIPVIGVGGIKSGDFIDSSLSNKRVDFTAIGRAISENPSEWYQKNLAQNSDSLVMV